MLMDELNSSLIARELPLSLALTVDGKFPEAETLGDNDRIVIFIEKGEIKVRLTDKGKTVTRDYTLPPKLWQVTVDEIIDQAIKQGYIKEQYRKACKDAFSKLSGIEKGAYGENGNLDVISHNSRNDEFVIPKGCYDETTITLNANRAAEQAYQTHVVETVCIVSAAIPFLLVLYAKGYLNFLKNLIPKEEKAPPVKDEPFIVTQAKPTKLIAVAKVSIPVKEEQPQELTFAEKARIRNRKKFAEEWVKEQERKSRED